MEKKKIVLSTQEELRIFMSPQRQKLLRVMGIAGRPMTAKELADKMEISASSAQLHIRKLAALGLLEKDHTERINGIIATYFRLTGAEVNIGLQKDDELSQERDAVAQNLLMRIYEGCRDTARRLGKRKDFNAKDSLRKYGDMRTGIVYLRPEDAEKLADFITSFTAEHEVPAEGAVPWEYAFIVHNTKADEESRQCVKHMRR